MHSHRPLAFRSDNRQINERHLASNDTCTVRSSPRKTTISSHCVSPSAFPSMSRAPSPTSPEASGAAAAFPGLRRVATRFVDNLLAVPSFFLVVPAITGSMLTYIGYQQSDAPRRWQKTASYAARRLPAQFAPLAGGCCCVALVVAAASEIQERRARTESSVLLAFPVAGALLDISDGRRVVMRNALVVGALGVAFAQYYRMHETDGCGDDETRRPRQETADGSSPELE